VYGKAPEHLREEQLDILQDATLGRLIRAIKYMIDKIIEWDTTGYIYIKSDKFQKRFFWCVQVPREIFWEAVYALVLYKFFRNIMFTSFENFFFTHCDAAESWQIGIQDPATPVLEGMIYFHNYLMFFLIVIGVFVFWMLYYVIAHFNENVHPIPEIFTHHSTLEIIWTIIPAVILLLIAVPSFALLYSLDESIDPNLTLKVIGHQWYWSYEYSDYATMDGGDIINFDSYMIPTSDLTKGALRLLEVDNRVMLPTKTNIRLLVTGADVLHSWAVPSFGIKIDACPGRLTQGSLFIKREGVYFGQCSEICGVNHGFMPIVVRGVSPENYLKWVSLKLPNLKIEL
jgi:cytochrome c oxidase subunit 2